MSQTRHTLRRNTASIIKGLICWKHNSEELKSCLKKIQKESQKCLKSFLQERSNGCYVRQRYVICFLSFLGLCNVTFIRNHVGVTTLAMINTTNFNESQDVSNETRTVGNAKTSGESNPERSGTSYR